jgi:hypothetical protein
VLSKQVQSSSNKGNGSRHRENRLPPNKHCRNGARKPKNGKRKEWLMSEVNRLRAVVAELIAENLTLEGGGLMDRVVVPRSPLSS